MFNTYIMHYTKLVDRREHIEKQLKNKNITNYELISEYDKESLNDNLIDLFYNRDRDEVNKKASITLVKNNIPKYDSSDLSLASISLCMKHILAMKKFIESDANIALMLEDDCCFYKDGECIEDIIKKAPNNWDIIFIGGSFSHAISHPIMKIDNYLLSSHPSTNTTSSFLMTKSAAKKTLEKMKQFSLPIDWELNYNFYENGFYVYHILPYIATQVSGTIFKGTVQR